MIGFGLLCGHLLGDYILQNDWMAWNKTSPHSGPEPLGGPPADYRLCREEEWHRRHDVHREWVDARRAYRRGHLACTAHCLLYTLAVWACSFWWLPWWGVAACYLAHWPIDRFRLAAWWMRNVSGQAYFASERHPLFPWSVVVVDNTFHLLTLFVIALMSGVT